MTSTFDNELRLNEQATGDNSGSWGTVTNLNLELIGEALGFGTQQVFGSDANATTTVADGAADPARAMYFKVTSSGNLTATRTMTVAPNTVSRLMFIENATSGSQSIAVSQGSGANVTIPTGQTKVVYLDGAGSGAAVVDAFAALSVVDLLVDDDLTVIGDLDVDGTANLDAVDIDGAVQIDNTVSVGVNDTGYDVKFFGDTASAFMLWDASADDLILGGAAGLSVNSAALVTGVLTTTAATVFNGGFAANDGSTISTADNTTQLTLVSTDADAAIGPVLDLFRNSASPSNFDPIGKIIFSGEDNGGNKTEYAHLQAYPQVVTGGSESGYFEIHSLVGGTDRVRIEANAEQVVINQPGIDSDFRVESTDGQHSLFVEGSTGNIGMFGDAGVQTIDHYANYTTLTLGNTTGGTIQFEDDGVKIAEIFNNAESLVIGATRSNGDIFFKGLDGSTDITALTLDMSDIGSATFNGSTRAPFGLFGEIYEVTNGADISLTKVSEDSGIAVSCRSTTNGHTPYLTFQKTPATSGNYTATASGDFLGLINFKGVNTSGGSNEGARIQVVQNGALSGSVPATMIIEASGQAQLHMAANSTSGAAVCIGGTAISRRLDVRSTNITTAGFFYQDASDVALMQLGHAGATGSNTRTMIQFQNAAGTEKGTIKTTTSATSFNTSSDYRLKENVNYSWDATTRLKQLKPARFNWIEDDTNTLLDGFMAHEVTSVVPEATDGAKDGVKTVTNAVLNSFGNVLAEDVTEADWTAGKIALTDADGNEVAEATYPSNTSWTASKEMPVYQQIDQSKLVPLLVKTIQELEARITALEG